MFSFVFTEKPERKRIQNPWFVLFLEKKREENFWHKSALALIKLLSSGSTVTLSRARRVRFLVRQTCTE